MKNKWSYTALDDLVSSQIEVTRLSYDTHSQEYAEVWEWNDVAKQKTRKDYIEPFIKYTRKGGVVLVVGCGTGRDLKVLREAGFRYLGVDSSKGMLAEAVSSRNVDGPVLCTDLESLDLADCSFDGILIDSAIEHIRKSDVDDILEKLYKSLKKGGILLLRFRLGDGRVFEVEDVVGTRYFTSYKREESQKMVNSNGFEVIKDYHTKHLDDDRPGFHAYILRK